MVADAEAPGVKALGVDAAGVEAPDGLQLEAAGVEMTWDDSPGVPQGVIPGVAGVTITGAKTGLSVAARDSSCGVDGTNRASLIRYGLL